MSAHPTLNFAIPVCLLAPVWDYIAGGCCDAAILSRLAHVDRDEKISEHVNTGAEGTPQSIHTKTTDPLCVELPIARFWPAAAALAQEHVQEVPSKL